MFEEARNYILGDVIPDFVKQMGKCDNREQAEPSTLELFQQIAECIYPNSKIKIVIEMMDSNLNEPQNETEEFDQAPGRKSSLGTVRTSLFFDFDD